MQLRIKYTTTTGDTVEVTTNPFSVMQWERKYNTKISRISEEGLGIEDLLFLGWEATKLDGAVPPFDTWAQTITEITTIGDDPHPSRPAQSAGS